MVTGPPEWLRQVDARIALDSMRDGVPPPQPWLLEWLTVGQDEIVAAFHDCLGTAAEGQFRRLVLEGVPGAGKSHLLHLFRLLAERNNFLISECTQDLTARQTLNRPGVVYRELIRDLRLPKNDDGTDALAELLKAWSKVALPVVEYVPPNIYTLHALAQQHLVPAMAPNEMVPRRTGLALVAYLLAVRRGDDEARIVAENVLRGANIRNSDLIDVAKSCGLTGAVWVGYAPNDYNAPYWLGQFSVLCHIARAAGYSGTILLLDELESLVDVSLRRPSREKAYSVLHELLFNDHNAPSLVSVFAFTPAFLQGLRQDLSAGGDDYYAEWDPLWTDDHFEIQALSDSEARSIVDRIKTLFEVAYGESAGAMTRTDHESIIREWRRQRSTRQLVKLVVEHLDSR